MALTDENNMVMPVAPMYGGGNGGFGNGWGGDGWWIILLLLIAGGGWGNGFGGGFGGNNALGYDFPWLLNGQQNINTNTNNGFRDAMLNDGITSIRDGVGNLSTQLCNSTASVTQAINGGFANAETAANARQIANMQTAFGLQSQLAQCCCDNRLATANLGALVQSENCADRAAISDGIRDVIASQTAGTQRIIDQLCADKIEQKNDIIAQLRSELLYARGQASQDVQTAAIQAGQRALANEVEQYVLPTPRPAYIVNNPNCCTQNACGCGM